jgi:hypothetical protein
MAPRRSGRAVGGEAPGAAPRPEESSAGPAPDSVLTKVELDGVGLSRDLALYGR